MTETHSQDVTPRVTRQHAETVLTAVLEHAADWLDSVTTRPRITENYTNSRDGIAAPFAIEWGDDTACSAPPDWAYLAASGYDDGEVTISPVKLPEGIWALAIGGHTLALYPALPRDLAEQVLAAVKVKFAAWCWDFQTVNGKLDLDAPLVPVADEYQPQLVENYVWGTKGQSAPYAIIWEHGPESWAAIHLEDDEVDVETTVQLQDFVPGAVARHKVVKVPDGVWLEPMSGGVLGIYPAE